MDDVLILSMVFGSSDSNSYRNNVYQNQKNYADRWGHEFEVVEAPMDFKRHVTWQKMYEIKKRIDSYDLIVWFDADLMIMNYNYNIEEFLKDANLIISEDLDYRKLPNKNLRVNTGMMLWKGKDELSSKMIEKIINGKNQYTKNPYKHSHEQGSIRENMKNFEWFYENVYVSKPLGNYWYPSSLNLRMSDILLDKNSPKSLENIIFDGTKERHAKLNSFKGALERELLFEHGDFCVHFAGIPDRERLDLFRIFSNHVIK